MVVFGTGQRSAGPKQESPEANVASPILKPLRECLPLVEGGFRWRVENGAQINVMQEVGSAAIKK